ncbi:diaminopimelate epimerase [Buchnera aphidicola]|uniref:diaminopimelate epimerase n=1 Tax=Buchnera aphidicola TaxID=9 RepID=UPI0031B816D8
MLKINKKKIIFSKMHGLGNDFIIINNINNEFLINKKIIKKLSNRYLGIGFDQLLLIEKSNNTISDFFYRIFNSNGVEVSQCGNGVRCFVHYLYLKKIIIKKKISIQTKSSLMHAEFIKFKKNNSAIIKVNMGKPIFEPKKIPFLYKKKKKKYIINVNNKDIICGVVSVGNPHCVIKIKNIKNFNVKLFGKLITSHYLFPEFVNVSFMKIINKNNIFLRVYERYVGETNACGSAACASVAVGYLQKFLSNIVKVHLKGGNLKIFWKGLKHNLYMVGLSTFVYDGVIKI